jgi:cobalt-zinc-cadmium efflux system protein
MGHTRQHDHDHDHEHGHQHTHGISSNLKIAFVLNLLFTIIEFVGGALTNSMAILSDAIHDLGDTFAIGSSLFLENYSEKGRSKKFTFGYKRFSPLAALINSVILLAGSIIIIYETVPRLLQPEAVNAKGMLYLAILGVLINGAAVFRLKKGKSSLNQRTVMLHLLEDALGWVAVLIGSVIMLFWDFPIIDPILSLGIAAYILWNTLRNLKSVLKVFLQATPENVDIEEVNLELKNIPGVTSVHDTHVWSMDGNYHILTTHLVLKENKTLHEIATIRAAANGVLKKNHIEHATIQCEYEGEVCDLKEH